MIDRELQLNDLARTRLFSDLSREDFLKLLGLGKVTSFEPHTLLYKADTPNTKIYIVLRGELEVSYSFINPNNERDEILIPIEIIKPGNMWGYTTIFGQRKQYPYNVRVRAEICETIELEAVDVLEILLKSPVGKKSLFFQLAQIQAKRSIERQKKLMLLMCLSGILTTQPPQEQLKQMLKVTTLVMGVKKALVASFDAGSNIVTIQMAFGYDTISLFGLEESLEKDPVLSIVYNTGKPLQVTRQNFDQNYSLAPYSRPTMLAVPIRTHSAIVGTIFCADKNFEEFSSEDVLTLEAASPLFLIGLSNWLKKVNG